MTARCAPTTVQQAGPNAWSPVTVAVFCGCGLVRRLVVAQHCDDTHSVARFRRAIETAHIAGTWPLAAVYEEEAA